MKYTVRSCSNTYSRKPLFWSLKLFLNIVENLLEKLSAASDGSKQPGTERKRKRSESSTSSVTPSHHNLGQVNSQPSSGGNYNLIGGAFRGQVQGRGRGRGWDAHSAYSGNSYFSNNTGGGHQDRGRGHRGSVKEGRGDAPEAATGLAGRRLAPVRAAAGPSLLPCLN